MKKTKRAGPKLGPLSVLRWRKHTLEGKFKPQPAEIRFDDLPHLQNGGSWSAKDDQPKRRMEYYLGVLRSLGMSEADAMLMMSNLYWDCWSELVASGRRIEEFSADWKPTTDTWALEVMRHAIRRSEGATQ